MPYQAVKLSREFRTMPRREVLEWFLDDDGWELENCNAMPMELERLEQLSDIGWISDNRLGPMMNTIERMIKERGVYIGDVFAIREIPGAKSAQLARR